jgi:hypothetical protein
LTCVSDRHTVVMWPILHRGLTYEFITLGDFASWLFEERLLGLEKVGV